MPASFAPRPTVNACIAFLAAGFFTASTACAEPAGIAATPDVVVDVSGLPPEEALAELAATYGFSIERSGTRPETDLITGRFEGPLDEVVSRVLSDENHLIRHGAGTPSRIAKIILLGQAAKSPRPGTSPEAPGFAPSPSPIAMAVASPEPISQIAPAQTAAPQPLRVEALATTARPAVVQPKRLARISRRSGYRRTN